MTDEFFAVHQGGDIAFIAGVMKTLAATGGLDEEALAGAAQNGTLEETALNDGERHHPSM